MLADAGTIFFVFVETRYFGSFFISTYNDLSLILSESEALNVRDLLILFK